MAQFEVVLRFEKAFFEYSHTQPILTNVNFPIRRGAKVALMGQNGAGKSTLFGLMMKTLALDGGNIHIAPGATMATALQVIPRDEMDLTVRKYFQSFFSKKMYAIDPMIDDVLEVVNLHVHSHTPLYDRQMKSFSGGQQARLLLASALIQKPDILLLDEPTNNLDKAGIAHLTDFLVKYSKPSSSFHTMHHLERLHRGVLYLDIYNHTIEQYVGTIPMCRQ